MRSTFNGFAFMAVKTVSESPRFRAAKAIPWPQLTAELLAGGRDQKLGRVEEYRIDDGGGVRDPLERKTTGLSHEHFSSPSGSRDDRTWNDVRYLAPPLDRGMYARMRVPWLCALSTCTVPPRRIARSRIERSPR